MITDKDINELSDKCKAQTECKHYSSYFSSSNADKMENILTAELRANKISFAPSKPAQVHTLGAILKPDGSIRPILTAADHYIVQ